ncbi:MAG: spore germination protein [Firmicutes bacterium]|nr:spore germination protein [Bacillota bacterium]
MYNYISKVIRYLNANSHNNKAQNVNQAEVVLLSTLAKNLDNLVEHLGSINAIITRYLDMYLMLSTDSDPANLLADMGRNLAHQDISMDINENITRIKNTFGHNSDLDIRHSSFNDTKDIVYASLYIGSLIDRGMLNDLSLALIKFDQQCRDAKRSITIDELTGYFSGLTDSSERSGYETLCDDLLSGNTVFLINGYSKFFTIATPSYVGRSVEEPTSQTVIRGPKEGFTEKTINNILLIRKRIKHKDLRVETLDIGSVTHTMVTLMYLHKTAPDKVVQEVRTRLGKIEIDGVLEGGYIEELIKDDRYSIFPTFLSSEKPDSVSAALLEGKVAILVDGTPYVLTAPALLVEFLQASEDYYHHFIISSMIRFTRFIAFFLTLLVPAVYVAVTSFHQEILPTSLLVSIASQREGVPFPGLIEALTMEFTFEILREAGIRMPRAIGPAISIVGALVIGQAAVEAGIISAAMVIVVSITAISSFAIPNYEMSNAIRAVRFILMFMAGVLGLYGVFMGLIILTLQLCKINSMGIPYMTPIAPRIKGGNKDTIFRFPLWQLKKGSPSRRGTHSSVKQQYPVVSKQKEEQVVR